MREVVWTGDGDDDTISTSIWSGESRSHCAVGSLENSQTCGDYAPHWQRLTLAAADTRDLRARPRSLRADTGKSPGGR